MPQPTGHLPSSQAGSGDAMPHHDVLDHDLEETLEKDRAYLASTELPIITVSASYLEDLKGLHNMKENDTTQDVVFSRAHYSMAMGIAMQCWTTTIDPKKAWLVDPTNYVSTKNWGSITFTETVGKILARHNSLKKLKDLVDKFGRQKLPILGSITPPLQYLTQDVTKPILSFHIAAGNILATQGKEVVQVITDPHVREDYLANAELPNITFCVFDEKTKADFFVKAAKMGKQLPESKVTVTGPPIDPRIVSARKNKQPYGQRLAHHKKAATTQTKNERALRLCITTGGLGTNKGEIRKVLQQLLPELRKRHPSYHLMVNAGTHSDIRDMVLKEAKKQHVAAHQLSPRDPAHFSITARTAGTLLEHKNEKLPHSHPTVAHKLTILYHPQIVDSNELLIQHAFPWADGFITKPSGDMAYDAVAAGCFLLTLKEWGEWEHNIRETFEQLNIARRADLAHLPLQLESLSSSYTGIGFSWINQAMKHAQEIDPLFLNGAKKIIVAVKN